MAHMGKGVAVQAALRWQSLPTLLGERLFASGNRLYIFQVPITLRECLNCLTLVTFPTKNDWHDPSSIDLIQHSLRELAAAKIQNGWTNVCLPLIGCGEGGLSREDVIPMMVSALDNSFILVELI